MAAPSFYNQADQDIYNLGYSFIPQEMYRGGAFNLPTTNLSTAIKNNPSGIATLPTTFNMNRSSLFNESGPSMNQIRTDFDPTAYNLAMRNEVKFGSTVGPNPEMYFRPQSGISKALESGISFIPGIGTLAGIGKFLSNNLPINQRSILENELRGSGVLTDNIGRIVSQRGQYNTPEGIMAGYNAAMMNEGTFDKRTDRISKTLGSKYGLTKDQISGIIDGTIDEEDLGLNTNLISNLRNIELAKKNFINQKKKSAEIAAYRKSKRAKDKQMKDKKERDRLLDLGRDKDRGGFNPAGATQRSIRASREDKSGRGQRGGFTNPGKGSYGPHKAKGGRVPYTIGGLVSLL